MIPKETIDRIFDAARIDEVVSDFLPLKKRGVNMLGLCPFHNEKTPSFTVSPAKGIFKCFGCGESGNSVNFVMKHENMTYPEALKYLANKYGIDIKEEEQTSEEVLRQAERESLMAVTAFAQSRFKDLLLNHNEGRAIGLQYFYERGISDHLIEKFQLGYAVESWDDLQKAAAEKGFTTSQLLKVGLVVETEEKKVFDRFRGRVIFPIHNITGRPIGFGGRILDSTKSKAKYINSPESEIYHKSDVLYGLHLARTPITKAENCFLVEGYTDVISMHAAGIENVVASSGTSLTTGQIKLIKRYTNLITILYDGDAAGLKAAFRGIDMIIEEGLNVKIVLFPEGHDPDSFARSHSTDEIHTFLESSAKDFILFKSDLLSAEAGNDPIKKAAMIKDIVESISLVVENIDRMLYIRRTAAIVDMDEQILINEVNKYRKKRLFKTPEYADSEQSFTPPLAPQQITIKDNRQDHEKEILRVLLNYGRLEFNPELAGLNTLTGGAKDEAWPIAAFVVGSLTDDDIRLETDESIKKIFEEYIEAVQQENIPTEQYFTRHEDEKVKNMAINLVTYPHELHDWGKVSIEVTEETYPNVLARLVIASVFAFKLKIADSLRKELVESLKTEEDTKRIGEIQNRIMAITLVRNKIANEMGRSVLP